MQLNAKGFHKTYCEQETYALVHHSIQKAIVFVHRSVLQPRSFVIFIRFLLKLVSKSCTRICTSNWLVTYWEPCIKGKHCHYRTIPIGYWGKGSTVGWYKVLGFLYL